jgi:hypothetical protein
MEEEAKLIEQAKAYWQGFPEAPFSDTFKWIDSEGYEHMMTVRGWSGGKVIESVQKAEAKIAELGGMAPTKQRVPVSNEPVRVAIDDSGKELPQIKNFIAEKLSFSNVDGKVYWKVKGGVFTQYGVTVWPETLKAAGLDISEGKPAPDVNGWIAEFIEYEKDGKMKPQKVTRLLPPKA